MADFAFNVASRQDKKEIVDFFLSTLFGGVDGETVLAGLGVDPGNQEVISAFDEDVRECLTHHATVLARDEGCRLLL